MEDKNLKRLESDKTEKSNRRRAKPRKSITMALLFKNAIKNGSITINETIKHECRRKRI